MSRFNIFICNYIFQYFEHHKFESFSPTMVGYTGLREDNDTHEETIGRKRYTLILLLMHLEMGRGGVSFERCSSWEAKWSAWRKNLPGRLGDWVCLRGQRVGRKYDIFTDICESIWHRAQNFGASIDFTKDVVALIEKFWWGTIKSLKIVVGYTFTNIPENTQHQGFLGIMLLVLLFEKNSFISINLNKLFCSIHLNLTYE